MPRALWKPLGAGLFLVSEVPLYTLSLEPWTHEPTSQTQDIEPFTIIEWETARSALQAFGGRFADEGSVV